MKIDILTLFPAMFEGFLTESIMKRAIEKGSVTVTIHNIRDYSVEPNKQVDDYPYGGGNGMLMMCDPVFRAIEACKTEDSIVIMLTPDGKKYEQQLAYDLSKKQHLIFLCGHYEGFDERIRSICDMELSIGDFILTGGEIPSMAIIDSIIRLLPGVIIEASHLEESFNDHLLDYPNYTKPRSFRGMEVPEVLLSGHHENIRKWRMEQKIKRTKEKRPDILSRGE